MKYNLGTLDISFPVHDKLLRKQLISEQLCPECGGPLIQELKRCHACNFNAAVETYVKTTDLNS